MTTEEINRCSRLTHEPPEGMVEALHNTAIIKDKEVFLRGMGEDGKDISLCHYCAAECKDRCGADMANVLPDEFGDYIMDCNCPIALLYAISVGAAEMRSKLMRYEDAEEAACTGAGLNSLAAAVHQNAVNHGWWEEERTLPEILMLCVSELAEALEEYRNGRNASNCFYNCTSPIGYVGDNCVEKKTRKDCEKCNYNKPEGVAVELADCIIRILDYCGAACIDIEEAIRIKHEYNKSRPYRHGGKKC